MEGAKEGRKEGQRDRGTEGQRDRGTEGLGDYGRTMSMTSLRRLCLCLLLRFWKMSQFSSWSSLKPTARWWFSSTDSSLYIRASSESAGGRASHTHTHTQGLFFTQPAEGPAFFTFRRQHWRIEAQKMNRRCQ